ncbi:MAG: hypothetical protein AB7R89_13875 [Dehalococcoidia bacterium]
MTTRTYTIVHIPDNTPELSPDALGQHVTIRTNDDAICPRCGELCGALFSGMCMFCLHENDGLAPCTGGCGELAPEPEAGDPWCDDCLAATQPADDRHYQPAPSSLARDIAALPDAAYHTFWGRLLHEYLSDPPAPHDAEALQDAVEAFAQDHTTLRPLPSLAPTGTTAPPTRLAG